jgi:hypothetical protein
MNEEVIEYARIVKPLGSSRFQLEKLNGQTIESGLKGELKNKSKNNKIDKLDWVKVQNLGITVGGSQYKIIERIGTDKDKSVRDLKKCGLLSYKEIKKESNIDNNDMF